MINSSSRYTTTTGSRDGRSIVISVRKPTTSVEYVTYTAREGESFVSIAARLFNDPTQYWRIADINPQIAFPDKLSGGETVRVPR